MLALAVDFALGCVAAAFIAGLYRLARGPTLADRVLALDLLATDLAIAILLYGIRSDSSIHVEAALLLVMVGFAGTAIYCKFLLRGDLME